MQIFPNTLREFREEAGISQSQLARGIGTDHSYISRLEAGRRTPSLETLQAIIDYLGLDTIKSERLVMAAFNPAKARTLAKASASSIRMAHEALRRKPPKRL